MLLITLCAVSVTSCFLYRRCSHTHPQEKSSISQKKDPRRSPEHSYPAGLENSYPVDLVLDLNLDLLSSVSHSRMEYYIWCHHSLLCPITCLLFCALFCLASNTEQAPLGRLVTCLSLGFLGAVIIGDPFPVWLQEWPNGGWSFRSFISQRLFIGAWELYHFLCAMTIGEHLLYIYFILYCPKVRRQKASKNQIHPSDFISALYIAFHSECTIKGIYSFGVGWAPVL